MKRQVTASSVKEIEFGVATRLPGDETDIDEQTEVSPIPEENISPKRREIQPLTLVLTILGLALLLLIPSLLLMQRLQS